MEIRTDVTTQYIWRMRSVTRPFCPPSAISARFSSSNAGNTS